MEWVESLLKLLFGHLGPLGTTLVAAAAYMAWLHNQEREDHKKTRQLVADDAEKRLIIHQDYIRVLTEIKTILTQERHHGTDHEHNS